MIISKTERYANELALALHKLQSLVDTDARSAEARAEAKALRSRVAESNVCPYCGRPIEAWSQRRRDACADCSTRLDRMLMTKSRVKSGTYAADMLNKFRDDYEQLKYVPQNLGGSHAQAEAIMQAIDNLLVASAADKKVRQEMQRQRTREALMRKHMDSIRADLLALGASVDDAGFEDRVAEIYYNRYKDE